MPNLDNAPANGLQGQSYVYNYGTTPNTRTAVSQKVRLLAPVYGDNVALHQMGVVSSFNPSESKSVEPVRGVGFGDQIAELVPSVTEPMTGSFERALLYLCNLWQATGYAAGVDGPVRSLRHHRWPFDIEQQLVLSTLADYDLGGSGAANVGISGTAGQFDGGVNQITYPLTTPDRGPSAGGVGGRSSGGSTAFPPPEGAAFPGHSAIITMYEACWFNSWSTTFAKDSGMIMETGDVTITDTHDFASVYGEFLASGNDPSIGQLGSIRFGAEGLGTVSAAGGGIAGTATVSAFVTSSLPDQTP